MSWITKRSIEDWDAVIGVDLKGTFLSGQAVAKHVVPRKYGKIINISSLSESGNTRMQISPSHRNRSRSGLRLQPRSALQHSIQEGDGRHAV